MLTTEAILVLAKQKNRIFTKDLVARFHVSRQYASSLVAELVADRKLLKIGSTRKAFYVRPEFAHQHQSLYPNRYTKVFRNDALEEHRVLNDIEQNFPAIAKLPENICSIFTYAFSEILNNAIEHSTSVKIGVEVTVRNGEVSFIVTDSGVGVFRNVMRQRHLRSELEAIQDLLKGKTTTMPKSHSGEGIFFTSKVGNQFTLDSFGHQLIVNNDLPDVFVQTTKKIKKGTKVTFVIHAKAKQHLNDVFKKYTNSKKSNDYGFDTTEVRIKLYTMAGVHISRSQARRILSGLEKFKHIVFDFDKVPVVGQAFADEIFRVFHRQHPAITFKELNMNEGVKFMVKRAKNEAGKPSSQPRTKRKHELN